VKRFLIVRLGSLGDVIHAIPAVAALRVHVPDARIDWVTDPRYIEVLRLVRGVDRCVAVDTRDIGATLGTIRELRGTGYAAAFDFQGLIKSAVLARAAGATRTIGLPRGHLRESAARFFYTDMPDVGRAAHVIFKNLALLTAVGVRSSSVGFPLDIAVTPAARAAASQAGGNHVLLNPGAAWPNKRWPPERFGALAAAIRDRLGWRSIVLWGPGEESIAAAVVRASSNAASEAPPTTITDLFAMAKGARLMVSGDTGPLHIAAAVSTPVVALFGPTWPQRNGPWSSADVTLSQNGRCSCHYERRCRRADPCINGISVDEAIAAVERRVRPNTAETNGFGG
jgi:lipopolysaccharide heptosyltransferase I